MAISLLWKGTALEVVASRINVLFAAVGIEGSRQGAKAQREQSKDPTKPMKSPRNAALKK